MATYTNTLLAARQNTPFGPITLATGDSVVLDLAATTLSGTAAHLTATTVNLGASGTTTLNIGSASAVAAVGGAFTVAGSTTLSGDFSQSGAKTFSTGTSAVSLNGDVTVAADKDITAAAGDGAFDFSAASGLFKTSTGAVTIGPGAVTVSGAAALSSTLAVTGASTFTGATAHNGGLTGTTGSFSSTLAVTGASTFSGDVHIAGNLVLTDATQVTNLVSEQVLINDNHLYLNNAYTTDAAVTGGLVVNYDPTTTQTTVSGGAGFVAGVTATSNPTVVTAGSATFAASDLIQISGCTEPNNNGLFEVLTHVGTTLTIRGIGTSGCVEDFTQNQFTVAAAEAGGTITKIAVSVIRADSTGRWETASGSSTGMTFTNLARVTESDAVVLSSTLAVTGASTFTGATAHNDGLTGTTGSFSSTLAVTGASTFTGATAHNGGLTGTTGSLSSTLAVTGASTFTGATAHNGGLTSTSGSFSSTLAVTGASTFTGATAHNGGLTGTTGSFSSTLAVTGASTFTGATAHNGGLTGTTGSFSSTLAVTGDTTLSGNLAMASNKFLTMGGSQQGMLGYSSSASGVLLGVPAASGGTSSLYILSTLGAAVSVAGDGGLVFAKSQASNATSSGNTLLLKTDNSGGTAITGAYHSALRVALTGHANDTSGGVYSGVRFSNITKSGGSAKYYGFEMASVTTALDATFLLADNQAGAFSIKEGASAYLDITTTDGSESITLGASGVNAAVNINSGTGTIDIGSAAQARSVNVGTGAAAQTVTVGSATSTSTTTIQAGTGGIVLSMADNDSEALTIMEGANPYLTVNTSNGIESISFLKTVAIAANMGIVMASGSGKLTVGTGGITSVGSSGLNLGDSTHAPKVASMDSTARDALTAANGMLIYNTTSEQFEGYDSGWGALGSGGSVPGTDNLSFTINQDNTAADEDAELRINSGNGTNARYSSLKMVHEDAASAGLSFTFDQAPSAAGARGFGYTFASAASAAASGATAADAGGGFVVTLGTGGAASTTGGGTSGIGGAFSFAGGVGGAPAASTNVTGGVGGAYTVAGGVGGATSLTGQTGGAGGALTLASGAGGVGSASSTGGAGGLLALAAGAGGAAGGGTAGAGGSVTLDAGAGLTAGSITIGGTKAGSIVLGNATDNTSFTVASGTGTIDIGAAAQARSVNVGTGAAAQTVVLGSTNTSSGTTIQAGTGNLALNPNGAMIALAGASVGTNYSYIVGFTAEAAENVAVGDVLYLTTTGAVGKADANSAAKSFVVGIAAEAVNAEAAARVASLPGQVVAVSADLTGYIIGAPVFMSKTAGGLTNDVSGFTTSGDTIFRVGFVHTASGSGAGKILYMPQFMQVSA